jgi:tyrosine-protein phosphatase SIW14
MRLPLLPAVLLLAACACSRAQAPPPPAYATPAPELGIPNAARMGEGVYRGAQPDAAGMRTLREKGFRTLVSFRTGTGAKVEGMEVVEIPIEARIDSDPPTEEQVKRFFEVVLDPARRPVYIHCAFGKDRTGTMAAIYRIEVDGWTPQQAIDEMQHFGFRGWYRDLEEFVRGYRPRGYGRR